MPPDRECAGQSLTPFLSVFRDASGTLDLERVRDAFAEGRFERTERPWPQFGFTADAVWVRFELRSDRAEPVERLVELRTARMDELDWYEIGEGGIVRRVSAGSQRPRSDPLLDYRYPVFPARLAPGERREVFLRVRSQASVHIPLRIWSPISYAEAQGKSEAVFAAFFGYMGALSCCPWF